MASIRKRISVACAPAVAWDAIRDVGALHTRLVPGFVLDTRVDGEARIVTFANGMVVREPIVAVDDAEMRLAWGAEGAGLDHYNAWSRSSRSTTGDARCCGSRTCCRMNGRRTSRA